MRKKRAACCMIKPCKKRNGKETYIQSESVWRHQLIPLFNVTRSLPSVQSSTRNSPRSSPTTSLYNSFMVIHLPTSFSTSKILLQDPPQPTHSPYMALIQRNTLLLSRLNSTFFPHPIRIQSCATRRQVMRYNNTPRRMNCDEVQSPAFPFASYPAVAGPGGG